MTEKLNQPQNSEPGANLNDLMTIKQLITGNPAFTEGGIRALVFHGHRNGFNTCIRRIGRKILISRVAFVSWINTQNGGKSND